MNFQKVKLLGLGMLVVVVATGCASAKKGGEMAKAATPAAAAGAGDAAGSAGVTATADAGSGGGDQGGQKMGKDDMYVVKVGDCLWCISALEEIYNNPYKWPLILKANTDQITDADLIFPGWELNIPRGYSPEEEERSVNHAKTRGAWELGVVEDSDMKYLSGE